MSAQKHKAPTQVTIVQEEKSGFATWVEQNWRLGAVGAVVLTMAILGSQYLGQKERANRDAEWNVLMEAQATGEPDELLKAADLLAGTGIEGWAALTAAQIGASKREYDVAGEAAAKLSGYNEPLISSFSLPIGPDGADMTMIESLERALASQREQDAALSNIWENEPPPAGATRVRIDVDIAGTPGSITLALYDDLAPKHVENFLALVDADFYDGIKFHRVLEGFMVQTGDPNTKDPDQPLSSWGLGGPEDKIESEVDLQDLVHAKYVVAAAKGQEPESSGSQFYITTGTPYYLDEVHTIFGTVLDKEGRDVVDLLEQVGIRVQEPGEPASIPEEPIPFIVRIERVE